MTGESTGYYFAYNASIPYFGDEHRPYAIAAFTFACVYNLIPFLLFCVYPCGWFHILLNKTGCRCHTLHAFMDALLGAYSHKPRERRYFGAFFLCVRVGHVITITLLHTFTYFCVASYIVIATVLAVAVFQPYKNKWHNRIHIILFSAAAHSYLMVVFFQQGLAADPYKPENFRRYLYEYSTYVVIAIIPLYGVPALLRNVLPQNFIYRKIALWYTKLRIVKSSETTLSYRRESGERRALLMPRVA